MSKEIRLPSSNHTLMSVIIPIYNEEDCIGETLGRLQHELGPLKARAEIIAVDDGSTDRTQRVLSEWIGRDNRLKIVSHDRNLGKAQALRTGIRQSTGLYVAFFDADLQYAPRDLLRMLSCAQTERYDVITGTRNGERYRRERLIISRAYNRLMQLLFGVPVKDCNAGLQLLLREVAEDPNLFKYGLPLVVPYLHRRGRRISSVPVELDDRLGGQSKFFDENRVFGGAKTIKDLATGSRGILSLLLDLPRIRRVANG